MRRSLLPLWFFWASLASAGALSVTITSPAPETGFSNLQEPILLTGTCSSDVASVTVEYWYSTSGDRGGLDDAPLELIDTYELQKFQPGSGKFLYRIYPSLGNLGLGTNRYVVRVVSEGGQSAEASVRLFSSEYFGEKAKPVIYLYPPAETLVRVQVAPRLGLAVSDPPYGQGWTVKARPDGRLTDQATGASVPYLYWESPDDSRPFDAPDGFLVARADLEGFFRDKLAVLGLNAAETADFLDFWLPLLQDHPWVEISFWPRARIDAEAPLTVEPRPDALLRVYFDHRGFDEARPVPPQTLTPGVRGPFTVVEWGGRRYR